MPQINFGGAIWTNHALEKLRERGFSQDIASTTFNHPDKSIPQSTNGSVKFQKSFGKSLVTVIAKKNEKNEWIILSCWSDPPLPGSEDEKRNNAYRSYQKASPIGKVFITIKRQLGLSKY